MWAELSHVVPEEPMYEVVKSVRFEAAHLLPHHDGKCQRLHGHSFIAEITVRREDLHSTGPKQGMAIDFGDIKDAVKPLIENKLDHYYLNESTGLESPTSENLSKWIFDNLEPKLPGLYSVTVHETCTARATYYR